MRAARICFLTLVPTGALAGVATASQFPSLAGTWIPEPAASTQIWTLYPIRYSFRRGTVALAYVNPRLALSLWLLLMVVSVPFGRVYNRMLSGCRPNVGSAV
jgi:hypothetical protein